jgi:hypothetical protein
MEPSYEKHFTAFIDLLGFSEVTRGTDDTLRLQVLTLLSALADLRGEFDVQRADRENGKTSYIKPAISTFSDHIVISYPLQRIATDAGFDDLMMGFVIMNSFIPLLAGIAAAALRLGFLIRGGATIDNLYHAKGVVFGEALVEAFELECRVAVYPRVVLSSKVVNRSGWLDKQPHTHIKDHDGLHHVDYFRDLLHTSAAPGDAYGPAVKAWFAQQFRAALESTNPQLLKAMGISLDEIRWASYACLLLCPNLADDARHAFQN